MRHVSVWITSASLMAGAVILCGAAWGQQASAGASAQAEAATTKTVELQPVKGELEGKLDAKTAKAGDAVALKTEAAVKTADGVEIPEGARLVGHVTDVQAHEKGTADSHIGLLFDRAEWKGGQSVAIRSAIIAVEPSQIAQAMASAQGQDAESAGPVSGGARSSGGGRVGGGGLLGGAAPVVGGVGAGTDSAIGGVARTTGNVVGDATADVGNSVHTASGATGSVVAQATQVRGISLATATTGTLSGTLYASKHNVHLDSGTQITLGVAASASAQ